MSEYELQRQQKIKQNQALLAELNINSIVPKRKKNVEDKSAAKRRKLSARTAVPSRTSARIAAIPPKPLEVDLDELDRSISTRNRPSKVKRPQIKTPHPPIAVKRESPRADASEIQAGWTSWKAVAPPPTRDEDRNFHFEDYPDFTPNKSPEEMLREGSFGGSYYRPVRSRALGIVVEDDWQELPKEWIDGLAVEQFLTNPEYDPEINKFKVKCGQSIEEWEAAGWIYHEYDVRGWFQWYTRFFQGRRCDDDYRQVSRWKKCVGETGRWRRMLLKKYMQMGVREVFDDGGDEEDSEVSPVMHQTCFHWAFEVRQPHLDAFWSSGSR